MQTSQTQPAVADYEYSPLGPSGIRLVTIDPGNNLLSVKSHVFSQIEDAPSYYALSYVWGDASLLEEIVFDGFRFQVTRNLHTILSSFRSHSPTERFYWIDALCINQANNDEKAQQVPRMGIIYRSAHHVLAWLASNNNILFEYAEKARDFRLKHGTSHSIEEFSDAFLEDCRMLGRLLLMWCQHEMHILLKKPFFTRVWIMQEVLLSRQWPLMCSGDKTVSMDALVSMWFLLEARAKTDLAVISTQQSLIELYFQRCDVQSLLDNAAQVPRSQRWRAGCLWTLLMARVGHREAGLPHDMIYSMLGMFTSICGPDALPQHLAPDYNLPPEKVYWDYSRWLIESTSDLNLLCHFGQSLNGVPSWVPDFRRPIGLTKTPNSSVRSEPFTPRVSADGLLLNVGAIKLGRCIAVCPGIADSEIPNPFCEQGFESLMANRKAHNQWLQHRCSLVETVICKRAVEISSTNGNNNKHLAQARLDVLRLDGMRPANPSAQALLMSLYLTNCCSSSHCTVQELLELTEKVDEIENAEKKNVWLWLDLQLSKQIFVTDQGIIGTSFHATQAEIKEGDEVFALDGVRGGCAFVMRGRQALTTTTKAEEEQSYTVVACSRLRVTEAEEDIAASQGYERACISIP